MNWLEVIGISVASMAASYVAVWIAVAFGIFFMCMANEQEEH